MSEQLETNIKIFHLQFKCLLHVFNLVEDLTGIDIHLIKPLSKYRTIMSKYQ